MLKNQNEWERSNTHYLGAEDTPHNETPKNFDLVCITERALMFTVKRLD